MFDKKLIFKLYKEVIQLQSKKEKIETTMKYHHTLARTAISKELAKIWIAAMKLKDAYSLEGKLWPT